MAGVRRIFKANEKRELTLSVLHSLWGKYFLFLFKKMCWVSFYDIHLIKMKFIYYITSIFQRFYFYFCNKQYISNSFFGTVLSQTQNLCLKCDLISFHLENIQRFVYHNKPKGQVGQVHFIWVRRDWTNFWSTRLRKFAQTSF